MLRAVPRGIGHRRGAEPRAAGAVEPRVPGEGHQQPRRAEVPRVAAEHFNWLVLSIPLHRSLYQPNTRPTDEELDAIADEAVRIFLAAYAAPQQRTGRGT